MMIRLTENELNTINRKICEIDVPIHNKNSRRNQCSLYFHYDKKVKFVITKDAKFDFESINIHGKVSRRESLELHSLIYHLNQWLISIKREEPSSRNIIKNIENISSKYYPTFKDAERISAFGMNESAGMIYRKALEILVKDFLILSLPNYKNEILKKTIGGTYNHFHNRNNEIKEKFNNEKALHMLKSFFQFVNETFALGNDFSHYERRLNEFSSIDLKQRILLIENYAVEHLRINELHQALAQKQNQMNSAPKIRKV